MAWYDPSRFRVFGTMVTATHKTHGTTGNARARRDERGRLFIKADQYDRLALKLCAAKCPCRGDHAAIDFHMDTGEVRVTHVSAGVVFFEPFGEHRPDRPYEARTRRTK